MLERTIANTTKPKAKVELKVTNQLDLNPDFLPISVNNPNSFRLVQNKKYIPFLGGLDNMPNLLLEARLTSTTHNACITSIARSAIGLGIAILNNDKPDTDFKTWMKSVNNKNQSLNKVLRIIAEGERTQGNQFIEVVRGEFKGKKFLKIFPHNMLFTRLNRPDDGTEPSAVVISKSIARTGMVTLKDDTLQIPLWSPNVLDQDNVWQQNEDGTESTMLHFKNELSGIEYYGIPASYSSLIQQILESKIGRYNIDNFNNNMILGGMLVFKSGMTQAEAEIQAREIVLSHTGEGKTGRIAVLSSEEGIADVQFTPYNTQKDGSYMEFDKRNEQKIISAHQWDSVLAGINRDSTLGSGSQYIRSIWDAKEAMLLNPYRGEIIDEVITPVQQIYSDWFGKPEVAAYELWFQPSMPFSFMGDINPETFMTVDEARDLAGLPSDPVNGKKYLSEMKASKTPPIQEQQNPINNE